MLRTDGGKEYRATDLFCESTGIHRQRAEPNQPLANGKAERMHRTLVDMARSMLFNSTMPVPFWGEAVQYACYVHNRIPTNSNSGQKSPLEALTGKIPKIADIVAFGSKCTVAVENKKGQTWSPRAMEGYIIGLSEEVKGYKVYVPKTGKTVITQHVKNIRTLTQEQNESLACVWEIEGEEFSQPGPSHQNPNAARAEGNASRKQRTRLRRQDPNESEEEEFPSSQDQISQRNQDASASETEGATNKQTQVKPTRTNEAGQVQDASGNETTENQEDQQPRPTSNDTQDNKTTNKNNRRVGYRTEGVHTRSKTKKAAMVSIDEELCFFMGQEDPKTYSQAMKSDKSEEWSKAIKDEIESLERLGTWELTKHEEGQAPLHSKWVFETKTNADGSVERYKARLVACGNEQEYGVNFYETFAPVMEMQPTVMTIFALGIMWGVPEAGDIPNAYPRAQVKNWLNVHLYLPKGKKLTREELSKLGVKDEKQVTLKVRKVYMDSSRQEDYGTIY
jgi:hypothetical protein